MADDCASSIEFRGFPMAVSEPLGAPGARAAVRQCHSASTAPHDLIRMSSGVRYECLYLSIDAQNLPSIYFHLHYIFHIYFIIFDLCLFSLHAFIIYIIMNIDACV